MKTILILAVIVIICSCGNDYPCPKETLLPAYIGYAQTEVDTIRLERYIKGTSFTQRADTLVFTNYNSVFSRSGDTTLLLPNFNREKISDEYDLRFINLFDNKTVDISSMQFRMEEGHRGGLFGWDRDILCTSPLISYMRDNTQVAVNSGTGGVFYIRR